MADFGCRECIPDVPRPVRTLGLRHTAELVDESHFGVSICVCPACGQSFVEVFTERIDWVNGEDPMTTTLMPLTTEEAGRLAADRDLDAIEALAVTRTFLRDEWPSDDERSVAYATGRLIGHHD